MKGIYMFNGVANVTLEKMFERFIMRKKALNLTEQSIVYYTNCYRYFCDYYSKDELASKITEDVYYGFAGHLRATKKDLSPITINSYLRGLRVILLFGMDEDMIPKFKMSMIKCEKEIKETYTDNELSLLLAKPDMKKCTFVEYRNWVMVNYLLATGNRLSSMMEIKVGDIDFHNSVILIRKTKNRKQQIIPLSVALSRVLKEYLDYREGGKDDFLFCDACGNEVTKCSVQKSIASYNRSRGVTKTSIHVFRHTFAKNWILNGGDIFRLQKMLGHSTLDIVKEYVNMFSADLHIGFDTFNPLDRIMKEKVSSKDRISMRK